MTYRYCEPISLKDARVFVKLYFDGVRIPWGSKVLWVAGVRWVTDQPGVYLIGGVGGLQGIQISAPAVENVGSKAS